MSCRACWRKKRVCTRGGSSFSKTSVENLAGAVGEEKVSTGREEEKAEKENTLQLFLIAAMLALAGSGQELRAERLWTEGMAGVDVHGVVVREQRHNSRGRGYHEGRMSMLVWHAAHHGFKFELRLLSRRQDGCALPGKEGP
jgi:hypothetical protein